jgi:hypothetical protein
MVRRGSYYVNSIRKLKYQCIRFLSVYSTQNNPQKSTLLGGRVSFDGFANHRVYVKNGSYPGLNMSRALGDLLGHQHAGISGDPEIKEINMRTGEGDDMIGVGCSLERK